MDKNWKKQSMPLILAPTHLDNGFNEKGRKTNGTIGDEGVKQDTPVYRDCMDMRVWGPFLEGLGCLLW